MSTSAKSPHESGLEIAIVGMAGRFPGAQNINEFWQNLRNGVEAITFFSDEELQASGIKPAVYDAPNYVKASGILEDIELFDASFFGYNPREAALMDPQQRLFLECAWEALEIAGYDAERYEGAIGVYAGVGMNSYLVNNLLARPDLLGAAISLPTAIGNDKDFLSTRVAYKLNLRGPAFTIQTACSTSLVATHLACQGLLNGECDLALAGGVLIQVPHKAGYVYQEGGTYSPDGHCRAFDANANGTTSGNGVAIVVLKRLQDALAARDRILAVIKGSAINNDGSDKVGFTAPSVHGQARVISEALALAGVEPETLGYIETHGTGTDLGDPIEMAALVQAFRPHTSRKNFCAIGSVKTNIGHTDAAAGVAGLVKTALMLAHEELVPSLHFVKPNSKIDFADSPFYVNAKLAEWKSDGAPRRAGVSSFGIGGTNAHVVMEEAPPRAASTSSRSQQLLVLSAKTSSALEAATQNVAAHLEQPPEQALADVAYTLQVGRKRFAHRRALVCATREEAIAALSSRDAKRVFTRAQNNSAGAMAFMFPGQGAQYVNMGLELYQTETVFRETVERGAEILRSHLGMDLRETLYPKDRNTEAASAQLKQTYLTQPGLFAVEYAMAKLWQSWGVQPQAMIGHSLGEYVAACLAGVFSLEDALALVAKRGRLMQDLPSGAMLAVPLPAEEMSNMLNGSLALAAINEPGSCVISGTHAAVAELEQHLAGKVEGCRRLQTSHAFHSSMMDGILAEFTSHVRKVRLAPPQIPYVSNLTGTWITASEATDPNYYARHLRQTVRFAEGVKTLLQEPDRLLLEVGPGRTLSTLAERQRDKKSQQVILSSLRHPNDRGSDLAFLLNTLGKLWLAGVEIDWAGFYANEKRLRVPLPTYPFERKRYWIEPSREAQAARSTLYKKQIADWFYLPSWKRVASPNAVSLRTLPHTPRPSSKADLLENVNGVTHATSVQATQSAKSICLMFMDACGLGEQLRESLQRNGHQVIAVFPAEKFSQREAEVYEINPDARADYEALLDSLRERELLPNRVAHLWNVISSTASHEPRSAIHDPQFTTTQTLGFFSLVHLARALGKEKFAKTMSINVVGCNMHEVLGEEDVHAEKATVLGACKVIPQEYPQLKCKSIDVLAPHDGNWNEKLVEQLGGELASETDETTLAYRGAHRWAQTFEPLRLEREHATPKLRKGGVYLITGGLGNIGLALAEHLAHVDQAKLVLTSRSGLLPREQWQQWLAAHGEDDVMSRKLRRVLAMEKAGAEVWVVAADVAHEMQMRDLLTQTYGRFGALHGVLHAAGCMEENAFQSLGEITAEECVRHFQPKVHGVRALEKVLTDKPLDFCMLFSSLSSVLGGLGYAAYAAANIFMDAFVHEHNRKSPVPWMSVNWDGWESQGQKAKGKGQKASEEALVIRPQEGVEAFRRVLGLAGIPQLVVSTGDLQARLDRWVKLESLEEKESRSSHEEAVAGHERPELASAYVAPRNEIEHRLAAIWQQLLGLERVGVEDNFFDLGGHSLLAIQVISRLRANFQIELSVQTLFNAPTIAELAEHIQKSRTPGERDVDKMARLLDLIENASDEEVKALLAEQ